jgi:hypothetical protein
MISIATSSFLCLLHRHANAIEAASATFDHNSQQHIKLWRDCGATTTAIEANQPLHLTAIHDNITNRDRSFNKCSQPRSRPQHKGQPCTNCSAIAIEAASAEFDYNYQEQPKFYAISRIVTAADI